LEEAPVFRIKVRAVKRARGRPVLPCGRIKGAKGKCWPILWQK